METVKHKLFGIGEVIKKEGNYITVRFVNDNSEKHFAIPASFQLGVLEAEGSLKDDVKNAIIAKTQKSVSPTESTKVLLSSEPNYCSKKRVSNILITGEIEAEYETYLINAGYKTETDDGKPSTVYAYIKAINFVLDEEGISWETLKLKISDIVKLYDSGGEKELLGNKSNGQ